VKAFGIWFAITDKKLSLEFQPSGRVAKVGAEV
jgi:hypothetical protein